MLPAHRETLSGGGYRFTGAQGICVFQVDLWPMTRDWSVLDAGSTCPVRLIHGALDPELFHARPDSIIGEVESFARICLGVADS